jgi:hypothetical protein
MRYSKTQSDTSALEEPQQSYIVLSVNRVGLGGLQVVEINSSAETQGPGRLVSNDAAVPAWQPLHIYGLVAKRGQQWLVVVFVVVYFLQTEEVGRAQCL